MLSGAGPPAASRLYFGCRNEGSDFYYRDLWEACQAAGVLAREGGLVMAFSRDQPRKVYVSHRIRDTAALLWRALQQVRPRLPMGGRAVENPFR